MHKEIFMTCGLLSLLAPIQARQKTEKDPPRRPNVLMIIVDDLRPELGCYGNGNVISPNIDSLAGSGIRFTNAYCNIPVSGASRASLLTGIRPGPDRFTSFEAYAQKDVPNAVTLPEYFRMTGYRTVSLSKVFHHQDDCPESWDVNWRPDEGNGTWRNYIEEDNLESERHGIIWSTECTDVKDNAYFDGQTAEMAVSQLKDLRKRGSPFFMAVGFLKPHLPFNAPKKYWDLYDEEDILLPPNYHLMNGSIPSKAFHTWGELRAYEDIPDKGQGPVPDNYARHLIHGYRACVSYTDAQIGKVLAALERLGMSDDTIIILFGDHGWSLGEHGEWCKHSTFDIVTNAPMIISAPWLPHGKTVDSVVEFVDIFPTLASICGLPALQQFDGKSIEPLLYERTEGWKNVAIVQWDRSLAAFTQDYGYTVWFDRSGKPVEQMLYDHTSDRPENYNIAGLPESEGIVTDMQRLIGEYGYKRITE